MSDELLDLAIATAGGRELWDTLRGLKADISIGGPIWATKGWPPEKTFDQILTLDTVREHIVFSPFTRPDRRMVFDAFGSQRRMDYVAEVNGSTLVGHYTGRHRSFDGLLVATRRRVFRRNPDNSVNLNLPSITLDIHDVELVHSDDEQVQP
ncbi:hypothetical protein ACIRRH_38105 [Kitasatospora sp. NPDC101235]|uniref:hypothetical protein n=1 Tax=Kitasatospora sp. NPDC101235 TaxID=3364101 RepID=UPI003800E137